MPTGRPPSKAGVPLALLSNSRMAPASRGLGAGGEGLMCGRFLPETAPSRPRSVVAVDRSVKAECDIRDPKEGSHPRISAVTNATDPMSGEAGDLGRPARQCDAPPAG